MILYDTTTAAAATATTTTVMMTTTTDDRKIFGALTMLVAKDLVRDPVVLPQAIGSLKSALTVTVVKALEFFFLLL